MKYGAVLLTPRRFGTSNFWKSTSSPMSSKRPGSELDRRTVVPLRARTMCFGMTHPEPLGRVSPVSCSEKHASFVSTFLGPGRAVLWRLQPGNQPGTRGLPIALDGDDGYAQHLGHILFPQAAKEPKFHDARRSRID